MKIQVKINKKPFNQVRIVGLLRACDQSLTLRQTKHMVEKEIEQDVDDILEFDLPNGSLVNVNIHDYNPNGEFDIIAAQGDKIPNKLSLIKTNINTLKPGTFVLIRDTDNEKWWLSVFSHYNDNENYPYAVLGEEVYAKCIPLEGNEHLLNTSDSANSSPIPEKPKLPTYDNEKKRYRVTFGNEEVYYTDQELYNFITGVVLHNRDIGLFTVTDTDTVRTISRKNNINN